MQENPIPPDVSKDDQNLAMLSHLLGIFTGFLGPMVIWLIKKDQSPYIEQHAKEAMNFQITAILATLLCLFGFCLAPVLFAAVQVARITFSIIAATKTSNGEMYRYPVIIRFIR